MALAAGWDHLGCWRCEGQPPLLPGPKIAGWVRFTGGGDWITEFGDLTVSLLLSQKDLLFLQKCRKSENIYCWASGFAIITRRTKLMPPLEIHVFRISSSVVKTSSSISGLAKLIVQNASSSKIRDVWSLVLTRHHSSAPIHPLALELLTSLQKHDPPGKQPSPARIFTLQMEATTYSQTCRLFASKLTRLGSSDYFYDKTTGRCLVGEKEYIYASRVPLKSVIIRGSVIIATHTHTLLGIASELVRDRRHLVRGRCLVVCSREVCVAAEEVLGVSCVSNTSLLTSTLRDYGDVSLVTTETITKCYAELSCSMVWDLVLLIDCSHRLFQKTSGRTFHEQPFYTLFPCSSQISLMLETDVQSCANSENTEFLAALLGAPADWAFDAQNLGDMLLQRSLRFPDEPHTRRRVIRYHIQQIQSPSNKEREEADRLHGDLKTRFLLLGPLATAGRRTPRVKEQGVPLNVHFHKCGAQVSNFAVESFKRTNANEMCGICMDDDAPPAAITFCGHWFCTSCMSRVLNDESARCPICRISLLARRDVALMRIQDVCSSFLDQLINLLKSHPVSETKSIVIAPFGNSHQRVAHCLRHLGLQILSWSGSAAQLRRISSKFRSWSAGTLLCDPGFFSLRWMRFMDVKQVFCLHDAIATDMDRCCTFRHMRDVAPNAQVTLLVRDSGNLPMEMPTCDCNPSDCPMLVPT